MRLSRWRSTLRRIFVNFLLRRVSVVFSFLFVPFLFWINTQGTWCFFEVTCAKKSDSTVDSWWTHPENKYSTPNWISGLCSDIGQRNSPWFRNVWDRGIPPWFDDLQQSLNSFESFHQISRLSSFVDVGSDFQLLFFWMVMVMKPLGIFTMDIGYSDTVSFKNYAKKKHKTTSVTSKKHRIFGMFLYKTPCKLRDGKRHGENSHQPKDTWLQPCW